MNSEEKKPVAWARKWYIDGEKPYKVKNPITNRMVWKSEFTMMPVSQRQIYKTDIPLFTSN